MADVKAFVWHDQHGNITAVGRAVSDRTKHVQALAHGDRRVVELSVPYERLQMLHVTHQIDTAKGTLMAREQTSRQGPQGDSSLA
jgi:hypothetical protein